MNASTIVLFIVDQPSAKWLEAALGDEIVDVPNIRSLLRSGVHFKNAFTSNPVCSPARATIATGMASRGHGLLENGYYLDPGLPNLMRTLQSAGWTTCLSGKLHLQPHYSGLYPSGEKYGFDAWNITEDTRGGEWLDWVERNYHDLYDAALTTVWSPEIPEFASYGPDGVNLAARIRELRATHSWGDEEFPQSTNEAYVLPFPKEASQTEWVTGRAEDHLRGASPQEPLFLQVSYVQPHGPSCPPRECVDLVETSRIPEPLAAEWRTEASPPPYFRKLLSGASMRDKPKNLNHSHKRRLYFADLAHLDEQLGRILRAVRDYRNAESTAFLFLSDHGELLFDHGFYGKSERHYDACIRVPLVISGPGIECAREEARFVQLEDIAPTILDLAGIEAPQHETDSPYLPPDHARDIMAGSSLLPYCRRDIISEHREFAYVESYNATRSNDPADWARSIRSARFRYTLYPRGNGEQLFDLLEDPDELQNIAQDPRHRSSKAELRDCLLEAVIAQDYPKSPRSLFQLGVH